MIKLPNTLQEVFDIVSTHLLKQGRKSVNISNRCVYRNENGMKCAAGALIPDDEYKPELETNMWTELVEKDLVEMKFQDEIDDLQYIHDLGPDDPEQCVLQWKFHLINFAKVNNLTHNIEV